MNPECLFSEKGQVAAEYLIMFAFLLVIVAVLFGYSFMSLNESISVHKAKDAALKITSASENIAGLGEGSRTTIRIELPDNVVSAVARENYVIITLQLASGNSDFVEYGNTTFSWTDLNTGRGVYNLTLEVSDGNIIISS